MAWWDWFRRKKEKKKVVIVPPTPSGIIVTDTTTGESVKTERRGGKVVRRTYRGGGGSARAREVISAVEEAQALEPQVDITPETPTAKKLQPATISALKLEEDKKYYKQSYWEALKQTGVRAGRDVKTFFTGRPGEAYIGYAGWFDPFKMVKKRKEERVAYTSIPVGTISPTAPTMKEVTFGDIQFEQVTVPRLIETAGITKRYKKGVEEYYGGLQKQVDIRELSIEEAEKLGAEKISEITPTYEKEIMGAYQRRPDIPGLYEQEGAIVSKIATRGFETATMFHPITAFGMAAYKGREPKEIIIESAEAGVPLYPEERYGYEPAIFAAGGLLRVAGKPFKIMKEIDVGRWSEGLKASPLTIPREIYTKGDKTFFIARKLKKTPYYEATTKMQYPVFIGEKGAFKIGAGTGRTTVRFLPFSEQIGTKGWRVTSKTFATAGRGQEAFITGITKEGISVKLAKPIEAIRGTGYIVPTGEEKIIRFGFAGTTKDYEKFIYGRGGLISRARAYPSGRRTILIEPKDYMLMKKGLGLDLTKGEGFRGWTSFRGGRIKSSAQYLESLYQAPQAESFGGAVAKITEKMVSPSIAPQIMKTPQRYIPSIYAGTGMYERMEEGLMPPITRAKTIQITIPTLTQRQIPETRQRFITPAIAGTALITIPKASQVPSFASAFRQKLGTKQIQQRMLAPRIPSFPLSTFAAPSIAPSPFKIPIVSWAWLPSGRIGTAVGGRMLPTKQIFGYTPSYAGFTWKIKAPKIPEAPFGKFTGLEIRPIVPGGLIKLKI